MYSPVQAGGVTLRTIVCTSMLVSTLILTGRFTLGMPIVVVIVIPGFTRTATMQSTQMKAITIVVKIVL
jgi:hypothetical protein